MKLDGCSDVQGLWTMHYPMLVQYLRRRTKDPGQAEDCAQATFVRAMENLGSIRAMSPSHAKAWLIRTAHNLLIDMVRKRKWETTGVETQETAYEEDFSGIHVQQRLAQLPPQMQEMVQLRHLEGYTSTEIGQRLQMPPATVRTRLRTAMILLRQYEAKENGGVHK